MKRASVCDSDNQYDDQEAPPSIQHHDQSNPQFGFRDSLSQKWMMPKLVEEQDPGKRRRLPEQVHIFCPQMERPMPSQEEPSKIRPLKLVFNEKFKPIMYTNNMVASENNGAPVGIMLVQTNSQELTKTIPLSPMIVELVVIDGQFDAEGREYWTKEEFGTHMLCARKDKRPLLIGECKIALNNGFGFVKDARFTDSSIWVSTQKFRLGAKVVGKEDQVMEAVSNPIRVKDQRGQKTQKPEILSPEDKVWLVKGIAKEGKYHQRLEKEGIHNVKDLVTKYYTDISLLSQILQIPTSHKKWETIVNHATSSIPREPGFQMSETQAEMLSQPPLDEFMAFDETIMFNSNDLPPLEYLSNNVSSDV